MAAVLLAEDDDALRKLVASALRGAGHDVVEVADGAAALDWLGEALETPRDPPDVVISDVRMPHATGFQVAASLRGAAPGIPTILMSAFGDPDAHALARRLGAVALLDKPFDLDALRELVTRAVAGRARCPRVLVVEHCTATAHALAEILCDEGIRAEHATTIDDALDAIARDRFDLVLLEVTLRGNAGCDVLASLREIAPDLAAIVLSGYAVDHPQVAAMVDAGAAYLPKPVDIARLAALVRWLVAERRDGDARARG